MFYGYLVSVLLIRSEYGWVCTVPRRDWTPEEVAEEVQGLDDERFEGAVLMFVHFCP